MAKLKVTISIDESTRANLTRLAKNRPVTISGLLNLAGGALTRDDVASLLNGGGFAREASGPEPLFELLCKQEREVREKMGEYPRNMEDDDVRSHVLVKVSRDHQDEINVLVSEMEGDVQHEIDTEERYR